MSNRLFAFMDDVPLGVFEQTGPDSASFAYEASYSGTPLSLSLPVGGNHDPKVAFAYLDGLLPEDEEYRERLAMREGTSSSVFGLLSCLGEDVAGAVVLSSHENLPDREVAPLVEANEDDIAYRIASLKRDPRSLPPMSTPMRFSLAGQQAKFSLANIGDQWFWSNARVPSTHIFKPPFEKHRGAERAEHAVLKLAHRIGIPASESRVATFRGQDTYLAKRWDRVNGWRIHAEDMLQAFGNPMTDKYGMYADDARELAAKSGVERDHLRQVLFNVAVGNRDAHAKNYSFLLSGDQVRLAPLYDSLPIFLWPQYDQALCLSVAGKSKLSEIRREDWIEWATQAGYDPEVVLTEIDEIFPQVVELLPESLGEAGLGKPAVDKAKQHVAQLDRSITRKSGPAL